MKSFSVTTTRIYVPKWVKKDFLPFSEEFERIRSGMTLKMNNCFKCKHRFEYGEMMALVHLQGVGNRVFCQKCVTELEG